MKSLSTLNLRVKLAALCVVGLAMGLMVFRAQADQWDKKTILTINQPIQVRDTLLQPGKYVFRLLDSSSDRHIVQIFNGDQSRIIGTVLAIPNYRLQPTGDSRFAFWETPPENVQALRAWFYPGDNYGQEFPYPKHLALAKVETPAAPAPPPAAAEPPRPETPEPQAQRQAIEEPQPEKQPVEVAQAAAPPPATPPPPPPQQEEPTPEKLPKTASPYPLIGFSGLFSLGLYGLLKLKRAE